MFCERKVRILFMCINFNSKTSFNSFENKNPFAQNYKRFCRIHLPTISEQAWNMFLESVSQPLTLLRRIGLKMLFIRWLRKRYALFQRLVFRSVRLACTSTNSTWSDWKNIWVPSQDHSKANVYLIAAGQFCRESYCILRAREAYSRYRSS